MIDEGIPAATKLLVKPPAATVELLLTDTCDRCGPDVAANTAIRLRSGGELRFCNHCYDGSEASLAPLVAAVVRRAVK
jgi:hypothetical protein